MEAPISLDASSYEIFSNWLEKQKRGGETEVERQTKLWGDAKRKLQLELKLHLELGKMHSLFVISLFCFVKKY
jgi:hypothetical protein